MAIEATAAGIVLVYGGFGAAMWIRGCEKVYPCSLFAVGVLNICLLQLGKVLKAW